MSADSLFPSFSVICKGVRGAVSELAFLMCRSEPLRRKLMAMSDDSNLSELHPSNMVGQMEDVIQSIPCDEVGRIKKSIPEEEFRGILEIIATTGKFWHEWDVLKRSLSYTMKQALAEYPESSLTPEIGPWPASLRGDTYQELVRRLEEDLTSFEEGPPFTLQRICEILLAPRIMYPSLSKLAFALEKNLLVTSTLAVSPEPYPSGPETVEDEKDQPEQAPIENGHGDVEMLDAEEPEVQPTSVEDNS